MSIGIISLSELLKDDFELRVAAFERLVPGQMFRARVRTLNPLTQRPVGRVAIDGELEVDLDTEADEDELKLKARGMTNGDGLLVLDFKVPDNVKVDGGNLTIRGSKGGVIREVDEDLDSDDQNGSVFLTADKPLYQPGQSFSARGLYFGVNNVVVADAELEFTIEDEDDTVLYRQRVKTSDFGTAAISWTIPENAKLGNYRLRVEADDDLRADQLMFKVSRYDLPNFTVSVKPDKSYYLPGDSGAEIAINADYLFGKPVNKGKVRVVQESDRQWNYRAQKYDVSEGPAVEGEADANGKFVAKIDLTDENAKLQGREWRRYEDIRFAAYFTDPSTNQSLFTCGQNRVARSSISSSSRDTGSMRRHRRLLFMIITTRRLRPRLHRSGLRLNETRRLGVYYEPFGRSRMTSGNSAVSCSEVFESISARSGFVPTFGLKFPFSS